MAHDVVDGHSRGECNASLKILGLLAIKDFLHFLFDKCVDILAKSVNVGAWNCEFFGLGECGYTMKDEFYLLTYHQ